MDIVIVGAGKAGFLHYNSYLKLDRAGVLDVSWVCFIDSTGRPGPDLTRLLQARNRQCEVYREFSDLGSRGIELHPDNTVIDLCLPSLTLAPEFLRWFNAGFCKFIIEKPFIVAPEIEREVAHAIEHSSAVLIRNYLHSRVHVTVRELLQRYGLDPLIAVTNFSKNRRADSARGRAFSRIKPPTVFEIEIPHQMYIGADLLGEPGKLLYVEDHEMAATGVTIPHLGEGVVVGQSEQGGLFVHYSNLQSSRIVRSLDIICQQHYSLHAIYAPICEELTDIKAGVVLSKGCNILEKRLFLEDDNMLNMIGYAYAAFKQHAPNRFASGDEVLRQSRMLHEVIGYGGREGGQPELHAHRLDLFQRWVLHAFRGGLKDGAAPAFLDFLEYLKREHFSNLLPAMGHVDRRATSERTGKII